MLLVLGVAVQHFQRCTAGLGPVRRSGPGRTPGTDIVVVVSSRRYAYRAYPTNGQGQLLVRLFGCVRAVFNDVIALHTAEHETGLPYSGLSLTQQFTTTWAKGHHRPWLGEVSATPLQQAVRDAEQAYRNFFTSLRGTRKGRRVGAPRYRSRHDHRQAARFTRQAYSGGIIKVRTTIGGVGKLFLPKIGWVRYAASRPLPAEPSSVSIIHSADGRFHVSFVVDVADTLESRPPDPGRAASVDLGLTDFAAVVYSDGTREKIANPRHLRAGTRRLKRAQRALARKANGSANRSKARLAVARAHTRVSDARTDFHHQLSTRLVRENQTVAVEALNVVGLARSMGRNAQGRGFRRSVHDAGWGSFTRILADKASEHGRQLVSVNPAHTSQTCAVCGVLDGPKPLKVREWTCHACDARLDRDYNAAVNIMVAAGLAETLNACGGDVRLRLAGADPDEAGTHRTHLGDAA